MGEKLWAGNKEKSGKLVVPKNKGAVLQNFRNRQIKTKILCAFYVPISLWKTSHGSCSCLHHQ